MFDFSAGTDKVFAFVDDDYSAVMVKVAFGKGVVDPVELSSEEARDFARALVELADRLDKHEE